MHIPVKGIITHQEKRPKQRWRRCTMEKHIKTNRTERDVNVRLVTLVHMLDLWIVNSIELWAIWSYISGLNNSKGEWELVYIQASQHHKWKGWKAILIQHNIHYTKKLINFRISSLFIFYKSVLIPFIHLMLWTIYVMLRLYIHISVSKSGKIANTVK